MFECLEIYQQSSSTFAVEREGDIETKQCLNTE